ncbi:MAG: hypothetical protein ACLVCW_01915 [Campylobacter sp.]
MFCRNDGSYTWRFGRKGRVTTRLTVSVEICAYPTSGGDRLCFRALREPFFSKARSLARVKFTAMRCKFGVEILSWRKISSAIHSINVFIHTLRGNR